MHVLCLLTTSSPQLEVILIPLVFIAFPILQHFQPLQLADESSRHEAPDGVWQEVLGHKVQHDCEGAEAEEDLADPEEWNQLWHAGLQGLGGKGCVRSRREGRLDASDGGQVEGAALRVGVFEACWALLNG